MGAPGEPTYTVGEVCELLGVSDTTVRRWCDLDPSDPEWLPNYRDRPNSPRKVLVKGVEKLLNARAEAGRQLAAGD